MTARAIACCLLMLTPGIAPAAAFVPPTSAAAPPTTAPSAVTQSAPAPGASTPPAAAQQPPAKPAAPKPAATSPTSKTPTTKPTKPATARTPAAPAAPLVEKPVPFAAGETLAYDISWASFVTAATATVTVREKRPSYDSTAYYIVAEGQPTALLSALYRLYYKADTLLDAFSLLPQRGSLYSREGSRQRLRSTIFDQKAHRAQYEVQAGSTVLKADAPRTLTLPAYTQDPLSAIYVMRAMELKPGLTMAMPVSLNGETLKLQVVVGERQSITSALGELRCWKVTPTIVDAKGQTDPRKLTLWISDDERRLPVSLQAELPIGRFGLTLREVSGR